MNLSLKKAIAYTLTLGLIGCNQTVTTIENPIVKPIQVANLESVKRSSIKHFSGVIQSQEKAALTFRVPGTISELLVQKGDQVVTGQTIARLDPHDYQVTLDELTARRLEALSIYKLAKSELSRVKQATKDNAIASVNLDRAISGFERSQSAIKVVNKNIQRAKDALSYTELKAPFDGVIADLHTNTYEQVLPGLPAVTLQDNTLLEVEIDVPENMIAEFTLGKPASISWYQAEHVLKSYVSEITTMPHRIKQTYLVTLTLPDSDPLLLPGKSVTVSTQVGDATTSYCLPYSAIIGESDQLYVNLVRDNTIVKHAIAVSSLDADQACIDSDFKENDYVVISGSSYLVEGDSAPNLIIKTL
ncbi:MAG: efflux RND transporter periplasmic adaptor subunit [Aliivibrio sp.]|uniref:efflux RND transporter periplasmic adaptor subunit n=1 Tax=Aliivibrio sp. TaxID=1872443 RepID=UPI001A5C656F|nr:efflux RND transporter periplasmic adaptor subunit [Aliivibrio sp.]